MTFLKRSKTTYEKEMSKVQFYRLRYDNRAGLCRLVYIELYELVTTIANEIYIYYCV